MSDIVERLNAASYTSVYTDVGTLWNLCDEAADEIERQAARIAELKRQLNHALDAGLKLSKERDEAREAARYCWRYFDGMHDEIDEAKQRWPWLEEKEGGIDG